MQMTTEQKMTKTPEEIAREAHSELQENRGFKSYLSKPEYMWLAEEAASLGIAEGRKESSHCGNPKDIPTPIKEDCVCFKAGYERGVADERKRFKITLSKDGEKDIREWAEEHEQRGRATLAKELLSLMEKAGINTEYEVLGNTKFAQTFEDMIEEATKTK